MIPSKLLAAAALAASLVPGLSRATPERVAFEVDGLDVVATLDLPDGGSFEDGAPPPAVVLLPSFGGSRDEMIVAGTDEPFFTRVARRWADDGIASLRVDYRYTGDSDGDFLDATMQSHVADGLAALEFLRRDGRVDPERLAVAGWSMGGAVAAAVAGESDTAVSALVMLNPALDLGTAFTLGLGVDAMRSAMADGATATLPLGSGESLEIGAPFLVSTLEVLPQVGLARHAGPVLIAVGTNDAIAFPQPALGEAALAAHRGEHELLVLPMDHYLNMTENADTVDEVIARAGDFLADRLR